MALLFLSVSGRPSASLISCLAAPPAPPPPNPNPTALPSLTCALRCPHFQSYAPPLHLSISLHLSTLSASHYNDDYRFVFAGVLVALKSTISTVRSSSTRPPTSTTNTAYLTSPSILWGWRCRAKLAVRGSSTNPLIGLYQEGTHNVVDIPDCKAYHPNISAAVELLKQGIAELNVEPYDEDQGTGELRYVQMVVTTYNTSLPYAERYRNGKVQVALVWNSRDENSPSSKKLNALANFLWRYGGPNRKVHLIHSVWANFQTSINNVMALLSGFAGVYTEAFDSQTKETLTIRQSSFGSKGELSQEFLKKVSKSGILPRSHLRQVHNEFHENALQVGTRLIELLLQTAYIQPRADQLDDGPPDIRPAFVHSLKTVVKEKNIGRRYGVIECDPLVRKGLERTLGATAVNLVAGEKPADVYSGIATRVLDIMRKDAQKDPEVFPDALCARLLINQWEQYLLGSTRPNRKYSLNQKNEDLSIDFFDFVMDKKVVKQTVMTSVYGVTYICARDQIKRRLKERNAIADDTELFGAACYAAKITLTALGEMFQAARSIMGWLGDCAKVVPYPL
ncbi:unnamed protein product [Camellia sinensis]